MRWVRSDNAAEMVKLRARRHRTTSRAAGDGWGEEGDSSEQGRREPGEKKMMRGGDIGREKREGDKKNFEVWDLWRGWLI